MRRVLLLSLFLLAAPAAAQDAPPSVQMASQDSQGDWLVVARVVLPDGGFVAVHDGQGPAPESVLGVSAYLEAGNHGHVPVRVEGLQEATVFAVLHGDDGDGTFGYVASDGQQDAPVVHEGQVVAAPAQVRPGGMATVAFEDQQLAPELRVAHASLPAGGFIAIHHEHFLDGEYFSSTVAASDLLGPGDHADIVIPVDLDDGGYLLAVAHQDGDGDGVYDFDITRGEEDPPYINGSLPVLQRAAVRNPGDAGSTVGAEREDPDENRTPWPGAAGVMVCLIALAALGRGRR